MRYVIIGSSAAGIKAAETLRKLDRDAAITVISEENEPPYSRCLLPEYLAGKRSRSELVFKAGNFFADHGIKAMLGERAVYVDPAEQEVVLESGEAIGYDKLLVATGSSSTCPPLPGIEKVGFTGVRTLDDADLILNRCRTGNKAVVIGGGFVGLETAYALNRRGLDVAVVEMAPHILALQFDAAAAEILAADMERSGIKIYAGAATKELLPPKGLERPGSDAENTVVLEDGTELKAHLVLTCTGTRPNVDVLDGTGVEINRGIVVNEHMETSVMNIYAAGDVCESTDLASGKRGLTPIWPNAVIQGKTAAYNMAGQSRQVSPLLGLQNAVEFREVPAIAAGLSTAGPGDGLEILTDYQPGRGIYRKIVLEDNVIKGMIFLGNIQNAGVMAALIRKRADVSGIKDRLLDNEFNYGYLWPGGAAQPEACEQETALV